MKTGFSNQIGNKGGVGISFRVGATSLLLLTAHLASGHTAVEQRNRSMERIERHMPLPIDGPHIGRVSERFDNVLLLGDLNYRIDGAISDVTEALRGGLHELLLENDQL